MKKTMWLVLAIVGTFGIACQSNKASEQSKATVENTQQQSTDSAKTEEFSEIKFEETEHNFGDITEGDVVKHIFKFTNTGNKPLTIKGVEVSCGCTTTSYTKEPVAPGATGEIQLQFSSQSQTGQKIKRATVFANVPGYKTELRLLANVYEKKDKKN